MENKEWCDIPRRRYSSDGSWHPWSVVYAVPTGHTRPTRGKYGCTWASGGNRDLTRNHTWTWTIYRTLLERNTCLRVSGSLPRVLDYAQLKRYLQMLSSVRPSRFLVHRARYLHITLALIGCVSFITSLGACLSGAESWSLSCLRGRLSGKGACSGAGTVFFVHLRASASDRRRGVRWGCHSVWPVSVLLPVGPATHFRPVMGFLGMSPFTQSVLPVAISTWVLQTQRERTCRPVLGVSTLISFAIWNSHPPAVVLQRGG